MPRWSGHLFIPRLEGRGKEGRDNGRQEQSTLRGGCWGRNPSRPGLKKYLSSTLTIVKFLILICPCISKIEGQIMFYVLYTMVLTLKQLVQLCHASNQHDRIFHFIKRKTVSKRI